MCCRDAITVPPSCRGRHTSAFDDAEMTREFLRDDAEFFAMPRAVSTTGPENAEENHRHGRCSKVAP
jgi:hypothetical protein